jgi:hypothetical protein
MIFAVGEISKQHVEPWGDIEAAPMEPREYIKAA